MKVKIIWHRLLSLLLCLVMVVGLLPTVALATDKMETPNISLDYEKEYLTGFLSGVSYMIDGQKVYLTKQNTTSIKPQWFGTTIRIVAKGTGSIDDSEAFELVIPARPATPAITDFEIVGASDKHLMDGSIRPLDPGIAYEYKPVWDYVWNPLDADGIRSYFDGNYQIRKAHTDSSFASMPTENINIGLRDSANITMITSVDITVPPAVIGTNPNHTPSGIVTEPQNAGLTIVEDGVTGWYEAGLFDFGSGHELSHFEDSFEAGNYYQYALHIYPEVGYEFPFDEDFIYTGTVTINGVEFNAEDNFAGALNPNPDDPILLFAECSYEHDNERVGRLLILAMFPAVPGYNVEITAGDGMSTTGDTMQTGLTGAMNEVVFAANKGYYFPKNYNVDEANGISVERISNTQIVVSGVPTADVAIVLPDASRITTVYPPSPNPTPISYKLHYESNGGTPYPDETYHYGRVVALDKVPSRDGYVFTGWYQDSALTIKISDIKMTGSKTVYAGWRVATVPDMLNGDHHFAYVVGYTDGTVKPNANISRAETAAIFFRLLKDDIRDGNLTDRNSFVDVDNTMWFNRAVSTMASLGIIKGRSADSFDPNANITRAEFAAICARFDTGLTEGGSSFTDISGHWAEAEIERAVSLGWIRGYADGTFRPDNYITRAEAMTLINRVLCRIPENESDLLKDMRTWPDCNPSDWFYLAVQEATNSHLYRAKGEVYETWTELTADPDWTRYQN